MKILIEGYNYDAAVVEKILPGLDLLRHGKNNKCRPEWVGYYFNDRINDCLFLLPKVLLNGPEYDEDKDPPKTDESLLLGRYNPQDFIDIDHPMGDKIMTKEDRDFIHSFSIWIYRALVVYHQKNKSTVSLKEENISVLDNMGNEVFGSHLDSVLSLIKFYDENRDFLLFTLQNIKRGYNKINWNKTISHRLGVVQGGTSVVYMDPVNQKKQVNYEEELLVIFYSILNYVNRHMGFDVKFNLYFELIPAEVFKNYLNGYGRSRLLQIRHKYFSDKALRLWNLCFNYFDRTWRMYSSRQNREYLLSTKFDRVFEDIIEDLIGDSGIDKNLKEQRDGKIVDHIFSYESLIRNHDEEINKIYYIGDSKYYKIGHTVEGNSIYKQYTYAKNVIQYNLNLFLERKQNGKPQGKVELPYRDELTEGYNITPNFFISSTIDPGNYDFEESELKEMELGKSHRCQCQFRNRLFDRDTLWLSHYSINFLYVLALYVRDNQYSKEVFKENARKQFRDNLIPDIEEEYDFYILEMRQIIGCLPADEERRKNNTLENLVKKHFKLLLGKIYHPYEPAPQHLILALEKKDSEKKDNKDLLTEIIKDFLIYPNYKLNQGSSIWDFVSNPKTKVLSSKEELDYFLIAQEGSL